MKMLFRAENVPAAALSLLDGDLLLIYGENQSIIMTAEQTAKRFIRPAYAAEFHKSGSFNRFYEIQSL